MLQCTIKQKHKGCHKATKFDVVEWEGTIC